MDDSQILRDQNFSGEKYDSGERIKIRTQTIEETNRFSINDLEPNRNYVVNFTIKAQLAHLSSKLSNTPFNSMETIKNFQLQFRTDFDLELTVSLSCNSSALSSNDPASCYMPNSNCSQCKSNCYKLNMSNKNTSGPIVCEACPCDTSRSTGECMTIVDSEVKSFRQEMVKCKMCIKPYTGLLCNECENEGVDYYKNEDGECIKCNCNNNAFLDSNFNSQKRKCQAITGK